MGPLEGAVGDPEATTINVKNVNGDPIRGAGAGVPGVPTINAKKRRWRPPWEVLTEIQKRPPST
jgi:hypothetical protein